MAEPGGRTLGNAAATDICSPAVEGGSVGLHGEGRVEVHGAAQHAGFIFVAHVSALHVGVDGEEIVEELGGKVDRTCHAVHACVAHDTVVAGVAHSHAVGEDACGTAYREGVVVRERCAGHLFLPVGVCVAEALVLCALFAIVFADIIAELACIHHVEVVARGVHKEVGGEVHLRLAALAGLGGDDNHTVRRTATVDSGCRSRLKDRDSLDILGVNEREGVRRTCHALVVHRHTVDNDKRCCGCVERCTASDSDVCSAGGVTAIGVYHHTGACANKEVLRCGCEAGLDVGGLHHAQRAGGVGFLHCTIAHNHEFAHGDGVGLEVHGDVGAVIHRYFLCVAAHIRDYQSGGRSHFDGELTVEVGDNAKACRAFNFDTCTDGGFAFGFIHSACDCDVLRKRRQGQGKHHYESCQGSAGHL